MTIAFLSTPRNADYSCITRVDENDAHSYHKLEQIPLAISWTFLNHCREGRIIGEGRGMKVDNNGFGRRSWRSWKGRRERERKAAVSRNMAAIAGCDKARLQSYRPSRAKACFGRISADILSSLCCCCCLPRGYFVPVSPSSPLFFRSFLLAAPLFSHLSFHLCPSSCQFPEFFISVLEKCPLNTSPLCFKFIFVTNSLLLLLLSFPLLVSPFGRTALRD